MLNRTLILKWIVTAVIAFAVKKLEEFKGEIDWKAFKAGICERVADFLPGKFFDAEGIAIASSTVDAIERVMAQQKSLGIILQLLADGKEEEAAEKLRVLLLKSWKPDPKNLADNNARSYIEGAA